MKFYVVILAVFLLLPACKNSRGKRTLIDLVKDGKIEEIRNALTGGEDVNQTDGEGTSVLHWAAAEADDVAVITLLIDAGADLSARDKYNMTPLHWAASQNENPNIALALIYAGAEISVRADLGITPLMIAASDSTNSDMVMLFIEKGADPRKKDERGWTAWDYIKDNKALQGTEAYGALSP